jgi:hypothetical protein
MTPSTGTAGTQPQPVATGGLVPAADAGIAGSILSSLGITDAGQISSVSVHGPYEDLGLEALKTLNIVIASAPPAVQQQFWKDWLAWHTGLQNLASKLDVFHLFVAKK